MPNDPGTPAAPAPQKRPGVLGVPAWGWVCVPFVPMPVRMSRASRGVHRAVITRSEWSTHSTDPLLSLSLVCPWLGPAPAQGSARRLLGLLLPLLAAAAPAAWTSARKTRAFLFLFALTLMNGLYLNAKAHLSLNWEWLIEQEQQWNRLCVLTASAAAGAPLQGLAKAWFHAGIQIPTNLLRNQVGFWDSYYMVWISFKNSKPGELCWFSVMECFEGQIFLFVLHRWHNFGGWTQHYQIQVHMLLFALNVER